jgi:hypothetical protein
MSPGNQAGWWAVVYLLMLGVTAYFNIFMIIFSFLRS